MQKHLLIAALLFAPDAATAEGNLADVKVDCLLFSKKANGAWFLAAETTIDFGGSQIRTVVVSWQTAGFPPPS